MEKINSNTAIAYKNVALYKMAAGICLFDNKLYSTIPTLCAESADNFLRYVIARQNEEDIESLGICTLRGLYNYIHKEDKSIEGVHTSISSLNEYFIDRKSTIEDYVLGDLVSAGQAIIDIKNILEYVIKNKKEENYGNY